MSAASARRRALGLVAATLLFAALTGAAMATYHGGSHFEPQATRYQPFGNYLSDLGATVTYSGRPNPLPRALFATASILIGIALAWSAPAWRAWNTQRRASGAVDATMASAVLAGAAFAAVGITPQNRWLGLHIVLVEVAFSLLLVFVAALAVVQVRNGAPRSLWIANVVLLVLLAAYVVLAVTGHGRFEPTMVRLEISAQKVVIVAALVDVALQAAALARSLATGRPRAGATTGRSAGAERSELVRG